jgi:hypothetical protein
MRDDDGCEVSMNRKEKFHRTIDCERASQEVELSYTEATIFDGMTPMWLKIGMRSCTGARVCGVHSASGASDWSKCPHLPKSRTIS